jgi:hypothetical protein
MHPRHTPIHKLLPHQQQQRKSIEGGLTNGVPQDCAKGYEQAMAKNAGLNGQGSGFGGMP